MLALAQWLEHTSVSQEIQKALWLIPLLQTNSHHRNRDGALRWV